jgi:hypothetical protein
MLNNVYGKCTGFLNFVLSWLIKGPRSELKGMLKGPKTYLRASKVPKSCPRAIHGPPAPNNRRKGPSIFKIKPQFQTYAHTRALGDFFVALSFTSGSWIHFVVHMDYFGGHNAYVEFP